MQPAASTRRISSAPVKACTVGVPNTCHLTTVEVRVTVGNAVVFVTVSVLDPEVRKRRRTLHGVIVN